MPLERNAPVMNPNRPLTDLPFWMLVRDLCVQQAPKTDPSRFLFEVKALLERQPFNTPKKISHLLAHVARGLRGATHADRDAIAKTLIQIMIKNRRLGDLARAWKEPHASRLKRAHQFSIAFGKACLDLSTSHKAIQAPESSHKLTDALTSVVRSIVTLTLSASTSSAPPKICGQPSFRWASLKLVTGLARFTKNQEDIAARDEYKAAVGASIEKKVMNKKTSPVRAPRERPRFYRRASGRNGSSGLLN